VIIPETDVRPGGERKLIYPAKEKIRKWEGEKVRKWEGGKVRR